MIDKFTKNNTYRVILTSLVFAACLFTTFSVKASSDSDMFSIRATSINRGGSLAGAPINSWGGGAGVATAVAWSDCAYGVDVQTPILAWHFESSRSTGIWWRAYDSVGSTTPAGNAELKCRIQADGTFPYCGTLNTTGGPDAAGFPGAAWYDLSTGVGVGLDQRGLIKSFVDADENFGAINNAFTLSMFVRRNGASLATPLFTKPFDYGASGVFFADTKMCMDVINGVNDGGTQCGNAGTQMADFPVTSEWVHWGFRFDGVAGTYHIFKDGVQVYEQTGITGTLVTGNFPLIIGSSNIFTRVDGGIAYPQIWNDHLTDAEMTYIATCKVPNL